MSTYAHAVQTGPEPKTENGSLRRVCDRAYYLLSAFTCSVTLQDYKGAIEYVGMAGKDLARFVEGHSPQ